MRKKYFEINLPAHLQLSLDEFQLGEEQKSTLMDCLYCELQAYQSRTNLELRLGLFDTRNFI